MTGALGLALLFTVALAAQRLIELWISARHVDRLRARGAVESGREHFWMFVVVHTLLVLGIFAEVAFLGARPGAAWPLWALLLAGAQALRYAAIHALGPYWNVRVWVIPGAELVRRGPYRFLKHPNYVAVVLELVAAPLLFGAWRTALVVGALNALALTVRIRCEDRALAAGSATPGAPTRP
ncbi:MAG: isoprenylcysteine carboxylmethyltransferase family protein [Candidatus Eisenbacteria bacterium]